ncbi:MAG: YebC/PmpR family DNA-binding transcriptional regulator, partial [Firmicutes bacterium]|nr:YebC/PmpR family DNA-binding transcriptional regulator [Bacillota bacterium]
LFYSVLYTLPSDFEKVKKELEGKKFIPSSYELTMVPQSSITLNRQAAGQLIKLLNILEEHEDVQKVHSNFEIEDALLEELVSS